jgi:peptidoglycan hydrolase CwlO-like protein
MANPDVTADPAPSISAAELRRRLMASTPPPLGSTASVDLDALAAQAGARTSVGRLTMPGQHGPVAANTLPPNLDPVGLPDMPYQPRSRLGSLESFGLSSLTNTVFAPPAAVAAPEVEHPAPTSSRPSSSSSKEPTADDYKRIKQENRELRKLLEEMKILLQEASENEQKVGVREQALQAQFNESQRHIADLTSQIQLIEEQVASGALSPAPAVPKTRDELEEWSDELEQDSAKLQQERRKLNEERQQLREDEESLENQMRQMEVSMARDRALMARQETELKRLSAEIQHELEIMQRGDASLREQLSKFQRRAQDVLQGKVNAPAPSGKR